ncbi:glycosyltransferase family A protein [Cerasicoccus arenae]|uniref:Glycosyltransferase 2-like domain-containing protein n=1 Tax=Cerasicoccus arenae TaxID=424488 RepID=A0A8J3DE61_9BACT|nr:glycosyltransferase family A protein [Cerasicoccus arenae]MBK1857889.1 glycosyltransferase family 2 protein [Cerasicoccus arenae]GHC09482.1 hypothetical protein GCM10007047_28400 [Cerasicoccus arenae]
MPWTSIIIPTHQRPILLKRAIVSVLRQDLSDWEIIVVSDGPCPDSQEVIAQFGDVRIRYRETSVLNNGNHSRNVGVQEARGEWVSFLDDDDEWLPHKLSTCRSHAKANNYRGILAHQVIRRSTRGEEVMPRREPDLGEAYPDYTFRRRSLVHGEGLLLTSSLSGPKDIWRKIPWGSRRVVLHDCDWLCRATVGMKTPWRVIMEPLSIWHFDDDRPRISNQKNSWKTYYLWARRQRHLFSPEAYAACLLTVVANEAARTHAYDALLYILREAIRNGRPGLRDLTVFTQIACLPESLRQQIRRAWLPH